MISPKGAPGIKHDYAVTGLRTAIVLPAKVQISSKETCDRFSKLTKTGKEPNVLKFLKLIEPRLKNIAVITEGPEPVIYGDIGLHEMIPISFMGGGMVRLLDIIIAIAWCENTVVFVDEVENGIHRSLLPKIWEAIGNAAENFKCQFIATTHSYVCLEAAHKGLANRPNDLRYIRLEREGDVITAKTSNYDMLGSAIAHNLEIR
ncbi:MAG: AAA family ATPase [Planctomycetota bacterium]